MNMKIIYHGSVSIVEKPTYGKGKPNNDYGLGFYCTENIELAKEWACTENTNGYVNKYEIDVSNLKILNLSTSKYGVLNWLAILMANRHCRLATPLSRRGRDYLINNFLPNYNDYDIIIGYRADDSYFSFARAFVSNEISLKQLEYAMKLGKLGEQIVLKSKKAIEQIKFLDFSVADNEVYYQKRRNRDINARDAFKKEIESEDINGIFIRDILKEEMKADDIRLR